MSAICHQICEFGSSDTAAAAHFGVPASTLSRWKFLNPDMELRFTSSREDFRNRHLHNLQTALTRDGRPDWRASAWLLERIFPQDYSRRPGRRVNPASEDRTWLDQAVAADLAGDDRIHRAQFENACHQGYEAARTYIAQPFWDGYEPNAHTPLPLTASFHATHQGPASLPSYASYAEALEQALHFDARRTTLEFPLPTPDRPGRQSETSAPESSKTSETPVPQTSATPVPCQCEADAPRRSETNPEPTSETSKTPATPDAPLPLPHHLHLPQATVPPTATTSKITETAAARVVPQLRDRPQASPRQASVTSAALGSHPTNSRPEGTAQETATPQSTSEITETLPAAVSSAPQPPIPVFPVLAEFPFLSPPKTNGFPLSQISQNSAACALST